MVTTSCGIREGMDCCDDKTCLGSLYCAWDLGAQRHICHKVPDDHGNRCLLDSDCKSGICANSTGDTWGKCSPLEKGQPCHKDQDCKSLDCPGIWGIFGGNHCS